MTMTHLWEPEHDFYGPEAPYWGEPAKYRPYIQEHESWRDYVDNGFASPGSGIGVGGMNLLYRWDWHMPDPEEGTEDMLPHLELFWMMPRKGIMARSVIRVQPEDEPAVRAFLQPHAEYMRGLWAPLL